MSLTMAAARLDPMAFFGRETNICLGSAAITTASVRIRQWT
jgi:hypothetical protein